MKTALLRKIRKRFLYQIIVTRCLPYNEIPQVYVNFIDTRTKRVYNNYSLKYSIEKMISLIYNDNKYDKLVKNRTYNRTLIQFKKINL